MLPYFGRVNYVNVCVTTSNGQHIGQLKCFFHFDIVLKPLFYT